ncbi:MAG: hypothetical protein ACREA2_24520 [Blastocatellia bacterium]
MNGRKFEEGDWADVYCGAKKIPLRGWSNLDIDVMHGSLGVEHKMLCYRSRVNLMDACRKTLMHPAATRSIRIPPTTDQPNKVMREVLSQYAQLIEARREKVREQSRSSQEPDMWTGWLLWQESLRQFMYFEEEMLPPNPVDYEAEWVESGGGNRKRSRNLWVYERETGVKRYSITTQAGAKIQPYFDVPPPTDPNLYLFTVIGEFVDTGYVRVWLTEATARDLKRLIGPLDTETVSATILNCSELTTQIEWAEISKAEFAEAVIITAEAYQVLQTTFPGMNDDHSFCLLAQFLQRGP